MASSLHATLRDVAFRHESATAPLFQDLTATLPRGFTGVVGANGSGKTTLLRLLAGELRPERGAVETPPLRLLCAQGTDEAPPGLEPLLAADDGEARVLRDRLGLDALDPARWDRLSHGERKRAQLAVALRARPDLLALDEPTNHVDAATRTLLIDALTRFRGVCVLVSHDRALLDALCGRCLWLEPPEAVLRPGGYTEGAAERDRERTAAARAHTDARRERDRLRTLRSRREEAADRSDRRRSKRGLGRHDHDAKARRDLARVSGKDGQAGRLSRQVDGRLAQAEARLAAHRIEKTHGGGFRVEGQRARRDRLLALPAGALSLGPGRTLHVPALEVRPQDRIAVTGPNGSGKSTLLRALLETPLVEAERVLVLPQELDAHRARAVLAELRALPKAELGRALQIVARLGSEPERLLATRTPSPGELRKLLLAVGVARAPQLLVLDEPTNHLDLPSIEALEAALADAPCALLLVSHDEAFLGSLTRTRWTLQRHPDGDCRLEVREGSGP
ncbi:MAG: ATP-binding cassette domain-containing protein [Pseudomonadales bacterium]|jgi:ATPase subunit of ABC transporter with duplicated ATPase domains|nr:ATP-binding cassette domain-containing protein [Pseudomonadales bacterium]